MHILRIGWIGSCVAHVLEGRRRIVSLDRRIPRMEQRLSRRRCSPVRSGIRNVSLSFCLESTGKQFHILITAIEWKCDKNFHDDELFAHSNSAIFIRWEQFILKPLKCVLFLPLHV